MKKDGRIIKNVLVGGLGQLITMALALFIPRLMIVSYGSDLNGLVSTISQIFTYLLLLEYGIGAATVNRLYRDFASGDQENINLTLSATRSYFNRVIFVYAACVLLFAAGFPYFVQTQVPHSTIRMIILVQGTGGIVNFAFTNTYNMLLSADGRSYIQTTLGLVQKVITSVGQILLINNGFSVISVQYVILFATAVKAVAIQIYVKRKYPWIKLARGVSSKILEQKSAYFVHEVCTVIFTSTDVVVIGMCCGTTAASVYAVYQLIFHSLTSVLKVITNSVTFKQGQLYNTDRKAYIKFHDSYETAYSALVFAFMTVTLYLALPFVELYTEGVSDAVYVEPYLPVMFALVQLLSCSRSTCTMLISMAGHAKKTVLNTILEAVLNLGISIVLALRIGIHGALIGTIAALLYRSNDIIIYANRKILERSPWSCYRTHGVFFALFALNYGLSRIWMPRIDGYGVFLVWGVILTVLMMILYGAAALALNPGLRKTVRGMGAGVLKKD